ncbi:MAG: hypothetical protein K2L82_00505 [Lachnospiraceae bacterium]|nr:hypothetical protein [Lachnospiraceae bacterium]
MHAKTMEGLIGARTNMNMTNVPMRVYKEARRKGDTATMERAMGYVNDFEDKAYQYKDKADEGMKDEAEEAREKEKLELEEAIAERREERKKAEEQKEAEIISNLSTSENPSGNTDTVPQTPKTDSVEISPEGSALLNQSADAIAANLPDAPVFYSSAGVADRNSTTQDGGAKLDVSV